MQKRPTAAELKKGGVLLIDKPYKWTSFDAVNSLKIALRAKIGHCGTLDPLATGLLICCTGEMTKQISGYQKLPKEYTGIFHLGAVTETYDLESEPMNERYGEDCTDLINDTIVKKVYCGYEDPSQDDSETYQHKKFHVEITKNQKI